jgi:hypothetical protein
MTIHLNHTIVAAHDHRASAIFLTELFDLPAPFLLGPFAAVQFGDTSLDFVESKGESTSQHYAFLSPKRSSTTSSSGYRNGGFPTGLIRLAGSATRSIPGTVGAESTSTIQAAICWKSSPAPTAAAARQRHGRIHWLLRRLGQKMTITGELGASGMRVVGLRPTVISESRTMSHVGTVFDNVAARQLAFFHDH